jgi:anthranilate synthase component I
VQDFMAGVERIRDWILAGDVFQVNLSRRLAGPNSMDPTACTRHWRQAIRPRLPGWRACPAVRCSAPHRSAWWKFVDRLVQTRRSPAPDRAAFRADQDASLSAELMAHPKERAEHIMLIDLERNDLGRVCQTGSGQGR